MPVPYRYTPQEAAEDIAAMPPPALPGPGGAMDTRVRPRVESNTRAFGVQATMLRLAGLTYAQIGEKLGVSDDTARLAVKRHLDRAEVWSAAELRRVENARLDRAQAAIWAKVVGGDITAVHAFLRISERRARLNGLDAPTTVNLDRGVRMELEAALTELETVLGEVVPSRAVEEGAGEGPEEAGRPSARHGAPS